MFRNQAKNLNQKFRYTCNPIRLIRKKGLVYVYEIKQKFEPKIQPDSIIVCFEITRVDNCMFQNQAKNLNQKNSSVIVPQKITNQKFDRTLSIIVNQKRQNFVDNHTFRNRTKVDISYSTDV